jgi:hypothetical protein
MVFSRFENAFLMRLLMALILLVTTAVFADDDDKPVAQSDADKQSTLILDEKTQTLAGLKTTRLETGRFYTEVSVTGEAISIQPLLVLRNRYLAALTENSQSLAKFKQAEQNRSRQQDLFRHGVTSKRNLQEHELQWQTDKTVVDANTLQIKAIAEETQLTWGKKLSAWILDTDPSKWAGFLAGKDVLLRISLPVDKSLSSDTNIIYVESSGRRDKASTARLISEAPQTDAPSQSQSYFFQGQGRLIKPGVRVFVWIPEKKRTLDGVMIPKSAGVWLLDQLFVYVKADKNSFVRRLVADYTVSPEGYLAATGFEAGEEIVTTGAQMLLSEEQRRQIPDEDD